MWSEKKLTTKKTNIEKFILKKKIEKKGLVLKSTRKTTMGEEARTYLKRIEEKDQDEFRTLLLNKTKLRGVQQMRTEPGLCKQHQGESNCTCWPCRIFLRIYDAFFYVYIIDILVDTDKQYICLNKPTYLTFLFSKTRLYCHLAT